MKRASITEAKNQLSSLLEYVRRGRRVVIFDRDVPVAQLIPAESGDAALGLLERSGALRRGRGKFDPKDFSGPVRPLHGGSVLDALLEERSSGR